MCKTAQNFDFPETEQSLGLFRLNCFYGFAIRSGRMELVACLMFCLVIKMLQNLYKKTYQTWQTAVKTLKKRETIPTRTHKKRRILFHKVLDEYTQFLNPFFWGTNFLKNQ